jgi:hypothetical protein
MPQNSTINNIELTHCIQRAEALTQVLAQALMEQDQTHLTITIEILEEYLLRARKVLDNV